MAAGWCEYSGRGGRFLHPGAAHAGRSGRTVSRPPVRSWGDHPLTRPRRSLQSKPTPRPPHAVSAFGLVPTMITICFDEALDPVSATDPSHYNFDSGAVVLSRNCRRTRGGCAECHRTCWQSVYRHPERLDRPERERGERSINGTTGGFIFLDVGDVAARGSLSAAAPTALKCSRAALTFGVSTIRSTFFTRRSKATLMCVCKLKTSAWLMRPRAAD